MLERLLKPEIQELIELGDLETLKEVLADWYPAEIVELIQFLEPQQDVVVFRLLKRDLAARVFEQLSRRKQRGLVKRLAHDHQLLSTLLNDLSPDDRTAFLEELPGTVTRRLLQLLDPEEREVATSLLGYPADSIGRLMTPDYVAVRPEWKVVRALMHIRRFGKDSETLNVIYVVDEKNHLLDDLHMREIVLASPDTHISDLMDEQFITLEATTGREKAVELFSACDRVALPVTDTTGILIGIVTVDDVLEVAKEEATEDIQKIGGSDPLDEPYLYTPLLGLVKKRAKWLVVLFLGELLTASAMGYFEQEISHAVVLALFIPLIISSGGNTGSQAATLIIRALAIGEVMPRDWWQVMRREILSGLALGGILCALGIFRIAAWQHLYHLYGIHWWPIALTVGLSLMGVVLWGTLTGSMLPFVLTKFGADPAASSAPFVATLVDVTGLVIYFSVAALLLGGTLL